MESIAALSKAMALAFPKIAAAIKGNVNPAFKSRYADLGAVIDAIKPALTEHGLWFAQFTQPSENGITIETVLFHESGESLRMGSLFLPATKHDAQGFGSCATYARRYSLMTAFGVPAEDDDGNAAVRSAPAAAAKPPAPPKIENDRHAQLAADFDNAKTLDQLAVLWQSMSPAERLAMIKTKDATKQRLSQELINA